ncbi:hypothetical protein [Nostoc punctiforme]|uniref:hypothetical protein n=1 Tax=Nostoc punctiforme TaxID=272131 RepID=UPI000038D0CA|nr:hypothetical protein [Nostoc punctiforme]
MKNFSLSLYAFHLRHTLTELPGEVVTDANLLRQRYRDARTIYSDLENKIQEFNSLISKNQTQLSGLKSLMGEIHKKSFDYTRCLQDLQTHHTSITTNIINYKICLDQIKTIGNGNRPKFWQDFFNKE